MCKPGWCWLLKKALYGTRKASQLWGEAARTAMDNGHWQCLQSIPNAFYLPAEPPCEDIEGDSRAVCHGDDFLAEGYERQLDEMDDLLKQHFEVTTGELIGPGRPGQMRCLKRIVGYTDSLPEAGEPGFFWTADPKHVDFLVQWTKKRGSKAAPTPGTKATGQGARDSLNLLSKPRAREVAGAGGTALYLSGDRPGTL